MEWGEREAGKGEHQSLQDELKGLGDFIHPPLLHSNLPFYPLLPPHPWPPVSAPALAFSRSQIRAAPGFVHALKSTFKCIYPHLRAQTLDELSSTSNTSCTHLNTPPPFFFIITPRCQIFPLFETRNSTLSLQPSTPSFFLSASLLTERTSLFSGGNGNVQTLNLNWAFLYDV